MYGIGSLWYGAVATAAATMVGFFPWFGVVSASNVRALPFANINNFSV